VAAGFPEDLHQPQTPNCRNLVVRGKVSRRIAGKSFRSIDFFPCLSAFASRFAIPPQLLPIKLTTVARRRRGGALLCDFLTQEH
jgi:hypothetical protein